MPRPVRCARPKNTKAAASGICAAQSSVLVRRRGLAARIASRAAVTRAVVVVTAVSFVVWFIGSSVLPDTRATLVARTCGVGVVGGGWSGDVAPAKQRGGGNSGTPPTLGITRPARHRPSGHKLTRPPMPQGLSAHPQGPTWPGPAGGPHNGDRPRASPPQARAQEAPRPSAASFSQPGTFLY